eukprot:CAMPEP_0198702748 /NCGR_PEP_ID=MMETSP1468-20131203/388941_1 /TAXON_ID=1461545 /ORGANISM="Mantoniella sp, Strain CCMP1436" /LENGTH=110 /DNA_ID=CAMNT_0044461329 /DNA_START=573 /DNA_END=905 /DNA_ORIENTATION=-
MMGPPPIAAHAQTNRGSCIGRNGDQRAPSASMFSAAHDQEAKPLSSTPPKTAKRPSLSTHPTIDVQRRTRPRGETVVVNTSKDCEAAVAQHAPDSAILVSVTPPRQNPKP